MPDRHHVLTPDALIMMDTIARTGSFAAAARELGKVPSALTYSVRQLEDALDVLLFDRRSRQAQLTEAGAELLREGRRLLQQMDAVANRVQRVASGWETQLSIAVDNAIAPSALFDLITAFYELDATAAQGTGRAKSKAKAEPSAAKVPTRMRLRNEVLSGTWEALLSGQADLAIGVVEQSPSSPSIHCEALGDIEFVFVVAAHHPLASLPEPLSLSTLAAHRIITVADTARDLQPLTLGVLPGQDVLTMPSMAAKLEAQLRGLGCGFLPEPLVRRHVQAGRLVQKKIDQARRIAQLHYAWRQGGPQLGKALSWWLTQLKSPTTRHALLEQHQGLIF